MKGKKNILVVGLGVFGSSVAKELYELGNDVLGIDIDMSRVQQMASQLTQTMQMDATDIESLRSLGVPDFDICIIGRGTKLEDSILIILSLKELGAKYVVAKATTDIQSKVLKKLGADRIVFPERDMGARMAHMLESPRLIDYIDLAGYSIQQIKPLPQFIGKSLAELQLRSKYGINVLLIKSGDLIKANPKPSEVINLGDILVIFGEDKDLEMFKE